ncbi:dehydrogenase [Weizmannia acidilactici]|uniref:Dehydrogenase n=1 Tax=Weizmannia acidilactici TaxID=2607726 RepID=A0A5J4JAY2_9BACI|nr:Gfo/Idh/MocA family oxidoreductase [Weizmannia acidilactici]GER66620.1 dehydrogenase [Weizmannia acidilactici]GER68891.1 dehydrogenase [Weizmannia acidilactici]GER73519.1 dehydrogenase [Weizmannia acidilactici]
MKIGVIGIGDIAKKAYLPVYAHTKEAEFHFFTRNQESLRYVKDHYRFEHLYPSLEALMESGIQAAFVHTATESHYEIVQKLLSNGIHVYVDKPVTYHYGQTKALADLAKEKNMHLFTGFNRRFSPVYQRCRELKKPNLILMQKNRFKHPENVRTFVYDDFIHVIDTLLYLADEPYEKVVVNGRKEGDLLYHANVQLIFPSGVVAIGIMNRDSGTSEEILEVMGTDEKRTARQVSSLTIQQNKTITQIAANDWEPTLCKRGFEQIVSHFIDVASGKAQPKITLDDALRTHDLCEYIVKNLEG